MNEMNNRYYDERDYDNRYDDRDYRDYSDRNYDDRDYDERRRYDRRGGKINNRSYRNYRNDRSYRNYRNYREQDFYEELEMYIEDMKEQYRQLEDIGEMAENPQDKATIVKIAQKEKENCMLLKQMLEKQM